MRKRKERRKQGIGRATWFVILSVLVHLLLFVVPLDTRIELDDFGDLRPVTLMIEVPPEPPQVPPEPEILPKGQIVDTAKLANQEKPKDADYLAESDRTVEKETRVDRYRINPEVLAIDFNQEDRVEFEDLLDLQVVDPSTGARIGNDRFEPDKDGSLASLPSPFVLTNKDGLQKPVPSSHKAERLSGAPNNDLLDEELGETLALNTKEILFANYLNRIRRLVNFYWSQNVDNLPSSVRLVQPRYETMVNVVLDGNGALEQIEVIKESGVPPLDSCVVEAFRIAGPFPNPPVQLVSKDGRVYLPNFDFTVQLGHARSPYMGVDPRQDVQFPGILKATR